MNFCEKVIELLEQRGISKRKLLLDLELNTNSFVNWQKRGTLPAAKTLTKISDYFGVPVSYFTDNTASSDSNVLHAVFSAQERNYSLLNGSMLPDDDVLVEIAKYLGCRVAYLTNIDLVNDSNTTSGITDNELKIVITILNILDKIASTELYQVLQVQISRIIISNLERLDVPINADVMKSELKFTHKKIDFLYSKRKPNMFASSDVGLNPSDLAKIHERYGISYTYMFTGKN